MQGLFFLKNNIVSLGTPLKKLKVSKISMEHSKFFQKIYAKCWQNFSQINFPIWEPTPQQISIANCDLSTNIQKQQQTID